VAAGIGKIAPHVIDAGLDARFDFIRTQAPEALLHGPHMDAHVVFDALRETVQLWKIRRVFRIQSQYFEEAFDVRLTVRACPGHLIAGA
jgi:hypothetical protein